MVSDPGKAQVRNAENEIKKENPVAAIKAGRIQLDNDQSRTEDGNDLEKRNERVTRHRNRLKPILTPGTALVHSQASL